MNATNMTFRKIVSFVGDILPNEVSINQEIPIIGVKRSERRKLYGLERGTFMANAPVKVTCGDKSVYAVGVFQLRDNIRNGQTFINTVCAAELGIDANEEVATEVIVAAVPDSERDTCLTSFRDSAIMASVQEPTTPGRDN